MCGAFSCMITGFSGLEAYSEIRANFFYKLVQPICKPFKITYNVVAIGILLSTLRPDMLLEGTI